MLYPVIHQKLNMDGVLLEQRFISNNRTKVLYRINKDIKLSDYARSHENIRIINRHNRKFIVIDSYYHVELKK